MRREGEVPGPRPAKDGPRSSNAIFDLGEPVFLLNAPFSLDTQVANNATMEKLGEGGRRIDRAKASAQWRELYHHLAARSLVYLLPSNAELQDQPFVANLGVAVETDRETTVVLSRFRARARGREPAAGRSFFRSMGIPTATSPSPLEGEADLKRLRTNVYFGGYGLRSSRAAHRWLADRFAVEVIPVALFDPHLYHLDCVLHVVAADCVLLATTACAPETVARIESLAEVVEVPLDLAYRGATNVARVGNQVLCDSCLPELRRSDPLYRIEKAKREFWEKFAARRGLEPVFFNLSEFYKSGAMLSCLVLPLTSPHLASPRDDGVS